MERSINCVIVKFNDLLCSMSQLVVAESHMFYLWLCVYKGGYPVAVCKWNCVFSSE